MTNSTDLPARRSRTNDNDDQEQTPKLSAVEQVKAGSGYLRGALENELSQTGVPFSADANQLLKFHGIYQQDDRDQRRRLVQAKEAPAYSCMVRCSVPGGVLSSDQWLQIDALADEVGDGTLRLTTRQGVQFHFVAKHDLETLIAKLNRRLITTYAACGDVVRNIMVTSAPFKARDMERMESMSRTLSQRFQPNSAAYWELWVDGEKAVSTHAPSGGSENAQVEPIYGDTYLPRKFKVGIAWPGDNSIDVYSQDVGLVLVEHPDDQTQGAVVLAGGGLGRSHRDPTTFPRLAEPLGWVPDRHIPDVVEAIVTTFRDHGNRQDRSHARLKYLVEDRGIDWLRQEVEQRAGLTLSQPPQLPAWSEPRRHLGWHQQPDDKWFLGLPVPSGRIRDNDKTSRRKAIREIAATRSFEIRLTPHQDMLLCGIDEHDRAAVDAILDTHNVPQVEDLSLTVVSSMACPALPTCGQALGEAERVLPEVTDLVHQLLVERGLQDVRIETRMTGCPNGCSRPYVAEIGIVARTKTAYDIFLGGNPSGTRLAGKYKESVAFGQLHDVLSTVFDSFKLHRSADEGFGDWAHRTGAQAVTG